MTDILIVGAGPAGLTAAIYALRAGKSVRLIEKAAIGGQMTHSPRIENYPGVPDVSGLELADRMTQQALNLGAEMELGEVTKLELSGKIKKVVTQDEIFEAGAVILAMGAKHRTLGLPREDALPGISYCAVCDGDFYRGEDVVIVGGGNSAMQEALLLSETCSRVTMVQNLPFLTGEQTLIDRVLAKENVSVIYGCVAEKLLGDDAFSGLTVKNTETGETKTVEAAGLFVAIGLLPDTAPAEGLLTLQNGYIAAGEDCLTSVPGVFTAGDCRVKGIRQVSTAAADGAVAALAAVRYLQNAEL